MRNLLLIRYGELGLKGKNKNQFIGRLVRNMRTALKDFDHATVRSSWGRLWAECNSDQQDEVIIALTKVFGIYSISPVIECDRNLEAMSEAVIQIIHQYLPNGGTFKVETRRADKTFPMPSPQISREVAMLAFKQLDDNYDADFFTPELMVDIEIRTEGVFVYGGKIHGAGGLPVGTGGKAMLLLSGGIDSPVAGWMAMRRGLQIEAIHFHSFPFTGEQSKEKVIDLCRLLAKWQGRSVKLHIIHFTEIQKAIRINCPEDYGITIMRRMMFRIAQRVAKEREGLALVTGESIGQVASQTLESMSVINKVVDIPVIRPLVALDKEDIMKVAKQIGTYETSILPFEDCCTIFLPKFPKIRPVLAEAEEMEQALDIEELINEALAKSKQLNIK